jgi:flagellar biosynthesis protein FlhG
MVAGRLAGESDLSVGVGVGVGGRSAERVFTVSLIGSKGGVGVTTLSVNLATLLVLSGYEVTLRGGDAYESSLDGLCRGWIATDLSRHPLERRLHVLRNGSFVNAFERRFSIRVVDIPGHRLSASQPALVESDAIFIVTDCSVSSVTSCYSIVKAYFVDCEFDALFLSVNRSVSAGAGSGVFGRLNATCERFLNFSLASGGFVLNDSCVGQASEHRTPLVVGFPRCPASLCLKALATRVLRVGAAWERQDGSSAESSGIWRRGLSPERRGGSFSAAIAGLFA